jgi:hypothetical protein
VQVLEEIKLEANGKMLMVHEPEKEIIDGIPKKNHRYEMIPRKSKLSIDLNRPTEEEPKLKYVNRVKAEIKPKIEGDRIRMTVISRCKPSHNRMIA